MWDLPALIGDSLDIVIDSSALQIEVWKKDHFVFFIVLQLLRDN
jgi:hypothetical protein